MRRNEVGGLPSMFQRGSRSVSANRLGLGVGILIATLVVSFFVPGVSGGPRLAAADQIACTEGALITAINAANTSGSGVIELPSGCTITLSGGTIYDGPGYSGTPAITGNVTIVGNGGTIRRSATTTSAFRLFTVRGGTLNLINVTLKNGLAQGGNGADYSSVNAGGSGGGGISGNGVQAPGNTGGGGGGSGGDASGTTGGPGVLGTGGAGGTSQGTAGGFGGGGGGAGTGGGAGGGGGFGAGGGGGSASTLGGLAGKFGGIGGYGGANGGGGGGAGLGGAVYVVGQVGTGPTSLLTGLGTTFSNNTAQGGNGGNSSSGVNSTGGGGGGAFGGAIFNAGTWCDVNSVFSSNQVIGGTAGNAGGSATTGGLDLYSFPGSGKPSQTTDGVTMTGNTPTCTASTVSVLGPWAMSSASAQTISIYARVSGVDGTVTFSVYNSNGTPLGVPVSAPVTLVNNTYGATAQFTIPGGTAVGLYPITGTYAPGPASGNVSASVDESHVLTISDTATPTNTPTFTPTDTPTNTNTPTPTGTKTATPTNTFTPSPVTPTNTPTNTPIPPPRIDSIGVFRPSTSGNTFYLRLHNTSGFADITVKFGPGTKPYPVVGDWTGAGYDTVGTYDQSNGLFTLCNANNTTTCANSANWIQFVLGVPNDQPLAGRWNAAFTHFGGGVFRPSNGLIYLRNTLTTGFANYTMVLGIPGDVGLAGDWNGDGLDSPGVYRPSNSTFYLNDQVCNCSEFGTYQFVYGVSGDAPVAGDWIGQGHDGIGLFRKTNGFTYLRNSLTTGFANITFVYGIAGDIPVAGHWQLTYPPEPSALDAATTSVPTASTPTATAPAEATGVGD